MFKGNHRFKLLRQLGAGGMGVVYEALDQQRDMRVALKTLREMDAHLLYRLKREFRSLRDLVHRNLVGLDELFEEDGYWFFTMELLDGEDLHAYLIGGGERAGARAPAANGAGNGAALPWEGSTIADSSPAEPPPVSAAIWPRAPVVDGDLQRALQAVDFHRVREVFRQVAEGLCAIHDAGKIHRDIKPSNIIIANGRAVILDFGLVTEQWGAARSGEGEVVGTLMYMAPEQATGQAVGVAADWYSVGVTLYEALTRQRLFESPWGGMLAAKQQASPRDPRERNPSCPEDLAELCMGLLQIDPLRRPQGPEVRRRLRAGTREAAADGAREAAAGAPRAADAAGAPRRQIFVGREGELRELRRAFADAARGTPITVFVHGESGIGKSTLLQHFVDTIGAHGDGAVILAGQCREHEAVPFKALDGIIDALAHHVCRLSDVAAAELVPQNAALLPGVFPVLGRIPAVAKAPRPIHAASDPFQQRKRVFTALREMLCLLTERYRLIWVIDDMQWADSDSLLLLEELLRSPDPPRLLLLASVRSEEGSPSLPRVPGEVRSIQLRPLDSEEAVELAGTLLERLAPEHKGQTARIVEETGGHPLFIGELVRHTASERRLAARQVRLDEAIWARVSGLDDTSLEVLELLALAAAPLSEEILRAAARLDSSSLQKGIALLRASYLARSASPTHASFEIYHDRVRQAVVQHLGEAQRVALNERIADALEAAGEHVSPELLIHHLRGAGQLAKAARRALEAADRAQLGLAFEQAIQLYEIALELAAWSEAERREILIKLGGALASAGRAPEAAGTYARAAEGADPLTQLSCRIQVADQLVQSGYLEKGIALLASLFQEHGHELPRSQLQIALWIGWYRVRLSVHGLRWTDRPRSEIQPRDLALLALYKAAARGLVMIDPVRGSYFAIRGLHLAMSIGERDSAIYFLMLEAGLRAGEGGERHAAFLEAADVLMRGHAEPLFQIIYRMHLGVRAYLRIDRSFEEAFQIIDRSDKELAQASNAARELTAARFFLVCSLHKLGDFVRLRSYAERFVQEAEQRGNIYARTTIRRLRNILWLVDDDPDGARADLGTDRWSSSASEYHMQHWLELRASVEIAIYEGSSVDHDYFSRHLKGLERSFLQRLLDYRCETAWMVGRLALSEAGRDPSQRQLVRRAAARLASYRTHYARMLADMLRATLAVQEGDRERAVSYFREVVAMGEAAHISFIAAAARRRLGALVGDEGRALVATAEQWMREAGIKNMERMTRLVSPCEIDAGGR